MTINSTIGINACNGGVTCTYHVAQVQGGEGEVGEIVSYCYVDIYHLLSEHTQSMCIERGNEILPARDRERGNLFQ